MNQQTPEQLCESHLSYAKGLVAGYCRRKRIDTRHLFEGQLEQAALVGLFEAARSFRFETEFRHFARARILGSVRDELRRNRADWSRSQNPPAVVSFDVAVHVRQHDDESAIEKLIKQEELEYLLGATRGKLRRVIRLRFQSGLTINQIAKHLHISPTWAARLIDKAVAQTCAEYRKRA